MRSSFGLFRSQTASSAPQFTFPALQSSCAAHFERTPCPRSAASSTHRSFARNAASKRQALSGFWLRAPSACFRSPWQPLL